ncbi:hypothetical protein SAMN05660642_01352 [Geodermatophilus siccatus]|uniref:Uncharacterized protein n=1 Tax=Geodermatophilus siccatus TaxID=1137991 RepID=A0A1G9PV02_9ACTN|nr:hypothetical protein [Geodermatophilus siccatus]SDM01935.1 hypothetical protein SAMN05660642_01352 [Geodermatophilus siccatus]
MPHASDGCTCWRAATETGESHTAAWLGMQERIVVVTRDGQRVTGRPVGPIWFRDEGAPEGEARLPGLDVELDDGAYFGIPLADVVSITPLVSPDPLKIVESVAHVLRNPLDVEDGMTGWTAIGGPHEVVQIEVKVRRVGCQATTPPPPHFQILAEDLPPR